MGTNELALEDRFVLFFDFLGTSEVATSWPRERVHEFVDLLISIAQAQSAEDISGNAQSDGSYRINVVPETTTFSDHVVVSYRSMELEPETFGIPADSIEVLSSNWTKIVCEDAIRILSWVAEIGLRIGLLIRGGISFGQLYHQGGVVFGEAMINAYALESKVADNPRIVVSERILAKLGDHKPEIMDAFLRDTDGRWHLNYFSAMVRAAMPPTPYATDQPTLWKRTH